MSGSQVTGWLLVLGAVAFGTGAGNPRLLRAWTAQEEVFLTIVARHPRAWLVTNLLFIVGTVLTVTGVALLPDVVPAGWPRQLAIAGATAFALAGSLWLVSLVYRLAVQPTVARGFAQTGATDPWVATLDRLSGGLFQAFIAIAFAGLAAIGVATTAGGPFPPDNPTAGATDLLISYTYRLAFGPQGANYGFAAAISILIFLIVAVISIVGFSRTKVLEEIN